MQTQRRVHTTYSTAKMVIWAVMAFQAGALNIGGYVTCQRFVSHVTGFASFFGFDITHGRYHQAAGMLLVPLFFVMGTMLSALLVDVRLSLHKKPRFYIPFGVIFFLIFLVYCLGSQGFFGPFGGDMDTAPGYLLLALLCFTCGLQNGTTTSLSRSAIRTTHLTGLTTDLGIDFVRLIHRKRRDFGERSGIRPTVSKIVILISFVLGSWAGAYTYRELEYVGFLLPTATSGLLFWASVSYKNFLDGSED